MLIIMLFSNCMDSVIYKIPFPGLEYEMKALNTGDFRDIYRWRN